MLPTTFESVAMGDWRVGEEEDEEEVVVLEEEGGGFWGQAGPGE